MRKNNGFVAIGLPHGTVCGPVNDAMRFFFTPEAAIRWRVERRSRSKRRWDRIQLGVIMRLWCQVDREESIG